MPKHLQPLKAELRQVANKLLAVPKPLLMARKKSKGFVLEINYHESFVKSLVEKV
jgi:hypothetical protein